MYYSPSPSANGTGQSPSSPAKFSVSDLMKTWIGPTFKTEITIAFLAGAEGEFYPIGPENNDAYSARILLYSSPPSGSSPTRVIRLIGIPDPVTRRLPKLKLLPPANNSTYDDPYQSQWPPRNVVYDPMISMHQPGAASQDSKFEERAYLKRIEIQNLELDGNFSGMGAITSAANDVGYRNRALELCAESGLIRNVVIQGFGSVASVPQSLPESDAEGVESFPIEFFTKYSATAPTSDANRWIVEEVTVRDFNSVHGGYGTMIIGGAFAPVADAATVQSVDVTPANARAIVRRCTVEGAVGNAFGIAGTVGRVSGTGYISAGVLFTDNVVLNSSLMFNADTGYCGPVALNNNIALDIFTGAQLGTPGLSATDTWHRRFDLSSNMFRLRGRRSVPVYRDYSISSLDQYGSDLSLVLGRYVTGFSSGLVMQGPVANLKFSNNRFTAWPQDQFYLPDPSILNPSTIPSLDYRQIFVIPTGTFVDEQYINRSRDYAIGAAVSGVTSTASFDFVGVANTGSIINPSPSLGPTSAGTSPGSVTGLTPALPAGAFVPRGVVRRTLLLPLTVPVAAADLLAKPPVPLAVTQATGVLEVVTGNCTWSGNTLSVPVRTAIHQNARVLSPGPATVPTQAVVRVEAVATLENGSTITLVPTVNPTVTPATGQATATFDFSSVSPNSNLSIQLKAWTDGSTTGSGPTFQVDQTSWATQSITRGTVVTLTASPDVGDDKNNATAKRAKLYFTRTGALGSSLPVNFTLPSSFTAPSGAQLIATYGTTGTADYSFGAIGGASLFPATGIPTRVTIPANQAQAVVEIVTRADNLTEQDIARVQLAIGAGYAVGPQRSVDVLIYDGPEWTIQELYDPNSYSTVSSSAKAVNNGTFASGAWSILPQAAGTVQVITIPGGTLEAWGADWTLGAATPSLISALFQSTGISDRPGLGLPSVVVGNNGSTAVRVLDNGVGLTTLKNLDSATPVSNALGISPDGNWIVGRSQKAGVYRPVYWNGTMLANLPVDMINVAAGGQKGTAFAVNKNKVAVGETQPSSVVRGFRVADISQVINEVTDILKAPGETTTPISTSAVALSSDARAAGSSKAVGQPARAVSWSSSSVSGQSLGSWQRRQRPVGCVLRVAIPCGRRHPLRLAPYDPTQP